MPRNRKLLNSGNTNHKPNLDSERNERKCGKCSVSKDRGINCNLCSEFFFSCCLAISEETLTFFENNNNNFKYFCNNCTENRVKSNDNALKLVEKEINHIKTCIDELSNKLLRIITQIVTNY